uniref:hypothetical protein n=1 Tax=Ornithobacterium rhinotracheale TaxID=28251 RepID=UPI0039A419C1
MSKKDLKNRLKAIFPEASITENEKFIKVHQNEFNNESLTNLYTKRENKDIVGNSTIKRSGKGVTLRINKNFR